MKAYQVNKIPNGRSIPWESAEVLNDFDYPWEKEKAPNTQFKALHDNEFVYFRFDVEDKNILTYQINNDKMEVGFSDRVEIFLAKDTALSSYFGLEIDSIGRVMDFKGSYHRNLAFDWTWPGSLDLNTSETGVGYSVEGRMSIKILKEFSLLNNDVMYVGLFRANCTELSNREDSIKWISWVDPKTSEPDFHLPEAFGILVLGE